MLDLRDKRVLVTGGAGFLGGYLVERLRQRGAAVSVPRSSDYDLVDGRAVESLFADTRPQVVLHLAAQVGGIGINSAQPGKFFYDNLMMGAQTMEVARVSGVEKFVAVGTVCAYPKHTPVPFHEDELWNGYPEETNAPYGIAKKMLLVQGQAYRQQYGFNAIHLLPVNLYGPRDNFDPQSSHVIPALIRKCVEANEAGQRQIEVWGSGSAHREFLYVEDCAEGIILAAERYNDAAPVNIGSGVEISIRDLVGKIAAATGYRGEVEWDTERPDGQPRRRLDISRARSFGFEPQVGFDEGLRLTVEWYRDQISRKSA